MRRLTALVLAGALLTACGGGGAKQQSSADATGSPTKVDLPAAGDPLARAGRDMVVQAGCLACHRVGHEGNDGPGPPLTHIGGMLSEAEIRKTIVEPVEPMPSYTSMPKAKLKALVRYLSGLR